MLDNSVVKSLIQAMETVEHQDLQQLLDTLKDQLLGSTTVPPAAVTDEVELIKFRPFVVGGADNYDNATTPEEHELAFVKMACAEGNRHMRRARKAYYHGIASLFVFLRNASPYDLAIMVRKELGVEMSKSQWVSQISRICLGFFKVDSKDPEIVAENKAKNDAVSRAVTLLRELEMAFKNHPVSQDDLDTIRQFLSNRDRTSRKTDAWFAAQILADPKPLKDLDESKEEPDSDEDGDTDDTAESDQSEDDSRDDTDDDADSGDDDGDDADSISENVIASVPPTKAMRMLSAAPAVPLKELVAGYAVGDLVTVTLRIEDGGFVGVAAIPCDETIAAKSYASVQARDNHEVAILKDVAVSIQVLTTPNPIDPNDTACGNLTPAEPGVAFTVVDEEITAFVASDTEAQGRTSMVRVIPTTEMRIGGLKDGTYLSRFWTERIPSKALCEAVAAKDAMLNAVLSMCCGCLVITTPRHPQVVIDVVGYKPTDSSAVYTPNIDLWHFTTSVKLNKQQALVISDKAADAFFRGDIKRQRPVVMNVSATDEGLMLELVGWNRRESYPATLVEQGCDSATILAIDFFKVLSTFRDIGLMFDVTIHISSHGLLGIRAFTEHSRIEVVIPPVVDGTIIRSDAFGVRFGVVDDLCGGDSQNDVPLLPPPPAALTSPATPVSEGAPDQTGDDAATIESEVASSENDESAAPPEVPPVADKAPAKPRAPRKPASEKVSASSTSGSKSPPKKPVDQSSPESAAEVTPDPEKLSAPATGAAKGKGKGKKQQVETTDNILVFKPPTPDEPAPPSSVA